MTVSFNSMSENKVAHESQECEKQITCLPISLKFIIKLKRPLRNDVINMQAFWQAISKHII